MNSAAVPEDVRDGSAPTGDPLLGFAVVGVLVAVVLAVCVVRTVPPHQRLVVPGRRGNRVRGPGLVAVWPPAARCVHVPVLPRELTVDGLVAVTADGVQITAAATARCRVADPDLFAGPPHAPGGTAWAAVDAAVESVVHQHVAAHDLVAHATATEPVLAAAAAADEASRWGIELGPVRLRGLTVAVDRRLVRWAAATTDERT